MASSESVGAERVLALQVQTDIVEFRFGRDFRDEFTIGSAALFVIDSSGEAPGNRATAAMTAGGWAYHIVCTDGARPPASRGP